MLFYVTMRYFLAFLLLAGSYCTGLGQEQTAGLLQETARTLMQKGDLENAVIMLDRARVQEPANIAVLRDLCYLTYLKRDFAKSIEVGKELVANPKADAQAFQMLGLSYKAIADYKECGKLYREGLRKFPGSGVLYNEYAELFALETDLEEAIAQWEKGIELDPTYSSNYYNATMFYVQKASWLRAIVYGELFLNLESYSTRTEDIKQKLTEAYRNLSNLDAIQTLQRIKTNSGFEKDMLAILAKTATQKKETAEIDMITRIRTRFLLEWLQGKQKIYPFRLFDQQQYLISQGLFEAYNYWLFSPVAVSAEAYQDWQKSHPKETEGYKNFQQSRVFKIPAGQYYFSH